MKYIAVIPARGGSKRFPGKNVAPLKGKPLIAYSIEYAKECALIEYVYVSTDSDEIGVVSEQYGAEVMPRSAELAGDFVPTADVLKDVAQKLLEQGVEFDAFVLLQPTNPLRPNDLLNDAMQIMETGKYDSLFSVTRCDKKLGKIMDSKFVPWNYTFGQRSQDLEPLYYENGLLYIIRKDLLLQGRIFGDTMYPLVVDHPFGEVDIDTKGDMAYAEYMLNVYGE